MLKMPPPPPFLAVQIHGKTFFDNNILYFIWQLSLREQQFHLYVRDNNGIEFYIHKQLSTKLIINVYLRMSYKYFKQNILLYGFLYHVNVKLVNFFEKKSLWQIGKYNADIYFLPKCDKIKLNLKLNSTVSLLLIIKSIARFRSMYTLTRSLNLFHITGTNISINKDTTEINISCFLPGSIPVGKVGLRTSLYDKRDDFNFYITNFAPMRSNFLFSSGFSLWCVYLTSHMVW